MLLEKERNNNNGCRRKSVIIFSWKQHHAAKIEALNTIHHKRARITLSRERPGSTKELQRGKKTQEGGFRLLPLLQHDEVGKCGILAIDHKIEGGGH